MVEEIVLEGRPFDTQKKYLKKFCENEGVDYNKVTKGVSELVDTLTEYVSSKSENLLKLIQYQAKDACVTDESITFIIEQAVNSKDLSEVALFHISVNHKYGMIDAEGNMRIKPIYDGLGFSFCDGLTTVEINGKEGYLDKAGRIVIDPRYDRASDFQDGVALVKANDESFLIDRTGNRISEILDYSEYSCFYDGLCRVKKDDKYGFIDKYGNVAVNPQFVEAENFNNERAQVRFEDRGQKCAFIDKSGRVIFEKDETHGRSIYSFKEGLLLDEKVFLKREKVRIGWFRTEERMSYFKKCGFLDIHGVTAIGYDFDDASSFVNGFARVKINGKYGFINNKGEIVVTPEFDSVYDFSNGLAAVVFNDKCGYIDVYGNMVIEPKFDGAAEFTKDGLAVIQMNEKYGVIDRSGNIVIEPQFCVAYGFYDGLCHVVLDEDFTQYGYINRLGEIVHINS
jgi:hypothetical protein